MTHIYAGMVLSSQPPFDPRYHGGVVVMLHNLSSVPFHMKCGERVATIEFVRLEAVPLKSKAHRSVTTLEEQMPKPFVSSLIEIAHMAKCAHKAVAWLSAQMLVFAAFIVAVLAVPGFFSYNSLQDRLSEQKDQLKEMSQTLEGYKREQELNRRSTEEMKKLLATMSQRTATSAADALPPADAGSQRP
jgi:ABC-type siderophore export system fused ATPase/permease subunit